MQPVYRIAIWGSGPAQAQKIREGEATYGALCKAELRGFNPKSSDDWAIDLLISADSDIDAASQIDGMTRHDRAVKGWTWNNLH